MACASPYRCRMGFIGVTLAVLLGTGLTGCSTAGPDHHPPQIGLPSDWSEAHGDFTAADPERLRAWWHAFDDPMLDRLVDQTLARNRDLAIAQARLRQARAERDRVAAGRGPTVSAGGMAEALRSSKALDWPPGIGPSRTWRAGFDASWELDLFGGIRRAVESADADIDALVRDRRALQVSLLAELAADYAELRTAQVRLSLDRDDIGTLRDGERLAERAWHRGLGTPTDVAQARAEREAAQARALLREADIARLSHAIGVLAGGFPGDGRAILAEPSPALPVVPPLPLSLPSEMIRQRPDLQADERRLAAATARIGVADAARFPHFSIPLSLGTTASLLRNLFSGASLAWSAGMQGSQTLYDGGRARAGVTAARAGAEAARLTYERDVQRALRDVEDALVVLNSERQRRRSLDAAVGDSRQALDHATRRYRAGVGAYLPVLAAQRAVHRARDALALSQWGELRGAIALYKSLGAGWQDAPVAPGARGTSIPDTPDTPDTNAGE